MLDEVLALARIVSATPRFALPASAAPQFARAVVDMLGEAAPCGFEQPTVRKGSVEIPESWCGEVEPRDVRALARMLLHAADEAEAK